MSNPFNVVDDQLHAQLTGFAALTTDVVPAVSIQLTDRGVDIRRFSQVEALQPEIWLTPAQNQPDIQISGASSIVVLRHEIHVIVPGLDHSVLRNIQFLIVRALLFWKDTQDTAGSTLAAPSPYVYGGMKLEDFAIQPPPGDPPQFDYPTLRAVATVRTELIGVDATIRADA